MKTGFRPLGVVAAAALLLVLSACGSSTTATRETEPDVVATAPSATPSDTAPSAAATRAPAASAKVIDVTITDDSVEPFGAQVKITRNQPVVLRITAASAGELHVHSKPERVIGFPEGDSEVTLSFDKEGIVDVEEHDQDKLILQFEVR